LRAVFFDAKKFRV